MIGLPDLVVAIVVVIALMSMALIVGVFSTDIQSKQSIEDRKEFIKAIELLEREITVSLTPAIKSFQVKIEAAGEAFRKMGKVYSKALRKIDDA